jgi:predicted GNAT family N-acyltransferase
MNDPSLRPVIRTISAAATRPMRREVLRPGQRLEDLAYPGDDDADTRHFGAFLGERIVGIASIYRRPRPGGNDPFDWQLRGMASAADRRGTGVGALLLLAALDHAAAAGGRHCWCHARVAAAGFYRRYGFAALGEVYEIAGIGPHLLMLRPLADRGSREPGADS